MSPVLTALDAAIPAARDAELTFPVAPNAAAGALDRLALVEMADAMAQEGSLLTPPAVPEIGSCRTWLLTEIASQLAGSSPVAWVDPGQLSAVREPARLPQDALVRLDSEPAPVVVADDANRIIYANDAASTLLGWQAADLVGQRLTAIIPPDLRDAHLAGFTRLQLGGAPQILDRPVAVPALRRDGTTVDVHLTVTAMVADRARTAYRASLVRTRAESTPAATVPVR